MREEPRVFWPAYTWLSGGKARVMGAKEYQEKLPLARGRRPRAPEGRVVVPGKGPVRGGWEPPLPPEGADEQYRYEYPVAPYCADILNALAELARAAGYGRPQAMAEVGEDYFRTWLEKQSASAGEASYRPSRRQSQARVALQVASERCAPRVREFVSRYGELVRDFAGWCARVQGQPWEHPDLAYSGHEARWWGEWATWAQGWGRRAEGPLDLAAPVAFYLWAAVMLTALRRHPEWPGCQVFLANRIAGLRLGCGGQLRSLWLDATGKGRRPERVGKANVFVYGDLLDYLGAAAGARGWEDRARVCANPECRAVFVSGDGRRRYCEGCANKQVRDRLSARKRYWAQRRGRR